MYCCQDANMYEKVTSVISWNCPNTHPIMKLSMQPTRNPMWEGRRSRTHPAECNIGY